MTSANQIILWFIATLCTHHSRSTFRNTTHPRLGSVSSRSRTLRLPLWLSIPATARRTFGMAVGVRGTCSILPVVVSRAQLRLMCTTLRMATSGLRLARRLASWMPSHPLLLLTALRRPRASTKRTLTAHLWGLMRMNSRPSGGNSPWPGQRWTGARPSAPTDLARVSIPANAN